MGTNIRTVLLTAMIGATGAATLAAQSAPPAGATPPPPGPTIRLTLDDAVKMALDHNVDLAAARLDPRISDMQVAEARAAFTPTLSTSLVRNNQIEPPSSFLVPIPTRDDAVTSDFGINQKLPWFGTSYNLSWNAVHTDSNSILNSYNPILQSGLSLTVSQPLLRDLQIDGARRQLATSRIDRDVADTRLHETAVRTVADVKGAYWNLKAAIANVDARNSALELDEELVRVNKAKVDVGQAPPLDLVAARAEMAADREQLIIAETAVRQVEDQLRVLVYDPSDRSVWNVSLVPVDPAPQALASPSLDLAVDTALRNRTDLVSVRKGIERAGVDEEFTNNQRLPDVRLNASYLASGLGGTSLLRTGTFPGTVLGPGPVTNFGSVLNQLLSGRYATWSVGVSVSYPLGQAVEEAEYARARLERTQLREQLKSSEARVVQQVRDAWRKIDMNAKRIETTRAARELASERLDAERKRFDVGMSTSFLVIQAQRDLTQARTNELAATLAYALALVDFDTVQQAAPPSVDQPSSGAQASGAQAADSRQ